VKEASYWGAFKGCRSQRDGTEDREALGKRIHRRSACWVKEKTEKNKGKRKKKTKFSLLLTTRTSKFSSRTPG